MIVTDRLPIVRKIQSLFIEDKNIVFYENLSECISKIEHLLSNEEHRQGIADAMEKRILKNHTGLARAIKAALPKKPPGTTTKIICVGDKSRAVLARSVGDRFIDQIVDARLLVLL